jgi:DNA modification methylase
MDDFVQLDLFEGSNRNSNTRQTAKQRRAARTGAFSDNMRLPIHRWFRYSAGFSAEWAEQFIKDSSTPARPVILDPFAGSGTTLLAAEQAGCMAYGYESHPFVHRIASGKLLWHTDENAFKNAAAVFLHRTKETTFPAPNTLPGLLTKCFTAETLRRLLALQQCYIKTRQESDEWQLIWLAITAILRTCSYVGTAQWQYVLPNKRKATVLDPFEAFEKKIAEMTTDMAFVKRAGFKSDATLFPHDARQPAPIANNSVDLVITSPPYPNNYDYADATRLEMTFWGDIASWGDLQNAVRRFIIRSCSQHTAAEQLGLADLLQDPMVTPIRVELTEVCNQLAEIRMTRGGKKTYHTMIAAYFSDLARVLLALRPVCKPGANLCFVIGDSAPYGVYVPTEQWLGCLAVAAGFHSFSFEKIRDRNIKWKNRKHRVPLHEGLLWING